MQPDLTRGAGASPTRSVSQWERTPPAQWFAGIDCIGSQAVAAAHGAGLQDQLATIASGG